MYQKHFEHTQGRGGWPLFENTDGWISDHCIVWQIVWWASSLVLWDMRTADIAVLCRMGFHWLSLVPLPTG